MNSKQRILRVVDLAGLQILDPVIRLVSGESPALQVRRLLLYVGAPLLAFSVFLGAWSLAARHIKTSFGTLPTPGEVWTAAGGLLDDHNASRRAARDFLAEQESRATQWEVESDRLEEQLVESDPSAAERKSQIVLLRERAAKAREKRYSGSPTYIDQILTSLKTVFAGFVVASLIAVPIGILCGLNRGVQAALNPLIQIFKPVSPLAWLPIVMIVVGALYTTDPREAWFEKSFISSAFTVALCSLWPTLVNTALGVASTDRDHINVARVLRLGWWTRVRKIVIPTALPMIFAGLRISLGVGWMVLIAAEMLAQNPGLGKFVWDMFQNGSTQTLSRILVAVFTIGLIGFFLDRVMIALQRSVSYSGGVA
jgi:nitrate/nitrite transport system permease protein